MRGAGIIAIPIAARASTSPLDSDRAGRIVLIRTADISRVIAEGLTRFEVFLR